MNFVGIDLHSNNNFTVIGDQGGRRLFEKRLPNDLKVILAHLERHAPIASVALESTYNYYWLADGLLDAGHKTLLANPLAMEPYSGLKHQDDKHDAGWMVELQRLGILPEAHLYSRQWRGVRDVLRQRSRWVREGTRALLSLQSRYARCRGWSLSKADLLSGPLPDLGDKEQNAAASSQVRVIRCLNEEIQILEKRVYKRLALEEKCHRRLMEVAGIGPVLASTIVLESGDLSRFRRVGKYASYARVVKSGKWTNHRKKGAGNRRSGNRYLGWAFHEAVHCMTRRCERMQAYRKRELSRGKHPRAVWSAMANKVCRGLYFVMKEGVKFSPELLFGTRGSQEGASSRLRVMQASPEAD